MSKNEAAIIENAILQISDILEESSETVRPWFFQMLEDVRYIPALAGLVAGKK